MHTFKLTLAALSCSLLFGCGGGSSNSSQNEPDPIIPQTTTYSGKVIDGYVSGATVWLDINGNGEQDDNEPSTVSKEAGDYAFEFTDQQARCVPYATMYVSVPVGAIDEDLGEVAEAYEMSFPPALAPIEDKTLLNISPLTSVIWEQIKAKYGPQDKSKILSCDALINDASLRNEISDEIKTVTNELVQFYNLSADQMYADFIKNDNSKAYDLAQSIVTGLKSAYQQRSNIQQERPNAEVRVRIYQSDKHDNEYKFDKSWYRDIVIFDRDLYISETVKLKSESELDEVDAVLVHLQSEDSVWGDDPQYTPKLKQRLDTYRNPQGSYYCSGNERLIFTKENVTYELNNSIPSRDSTDGNDCSNATFDKFFERQYNFRYQESGDSYSTELFFRESEAEFTKLSQWIDLKKNASTLDINELADYLSTIDYKYEDSVSVTTNYWRKRHVSGDTQIDQYSDGTWKKTVTNSDGTRTETCSTDGVTYGDCS